MKLLPLDTPERIELVAGWLACKENYQWLNFGAGRQIVTPALLKVMVQRDTHLLRAYTADEDEQLIGIAALNDVDRVNGTATLWGATGDKSFRNRGYATFAGSMLLGLAFRELGLKAINTWVVDGNPSQRVVERLKFRYIGRQRCCHCIDGRMYDRLFFDLLAEEYEDIVPQRPQRSEPTVPENEHA